MMVFVRGVNPIGQGDVSAQYLRFALTSVNCTKFGQSITSQESH